MKTVKNRKLFRSMLLAAFLFCFFAGQTAWSQTNANVTAQQIKSIRQSIHLCPLDVQKRLRLARVLKRNGDMRKATIEYLNVTAVDPACCIAYHEMLQSKATIEQIDECLERLTKYDQMAAPQLPIRMTLSELYENKGDYLGLDW